MESPQNMKVVTRRTGLSPHVLRVWEKRYQAVQPIRTDTNRRLYTEAQVEKLELLARLTGTGHAIGGIAHLETPDLRKLLGRCGSAPVATTGPAAEGEGEEACGFLTDAHAAVPAMDPAALEAVLESASVRLGHSGLLERVVVPLMHEIGERWHAGTLTAAAEHFASGVVKDYLARTARGFAPSPNAPRLVVATPAGQLHELGAVLVANLARKDGWNVVYLGASLPAEELAGAVQRTGALALVLSVVYPSDDPGLATEFRRLRHLLPPDFPILAGGRALGGYRDVLTEERICTGESLADFRFALAAVRSR